MSSGKTPCVVCGKECRDFNAEKFLGKTTWLCMCAWHYDMLASTYGYPSGGVDGGADGSIPQVVALIEKMKAELGDTPTIRNMQAVREVSCLTCSKKNDFGAKCCWWCGNSV